MTIAASTARAAAVAAAALALATSSTAVSSAETDPVDTATVGTCLHAEKVPGPGYTSRTTFDTAVCGTPYANVRITSIASDVSECPGMWIENPERGRVLCIEDV
jgi:hypothetical protein